MIEQFAPGLVLMVRVASVNGAAGDVTEMRVMVRSAAWAEPTWRPIKQRVRLSVRRWATAKGMEEEGRPERRGADPVGSMPRLW
jgi:hypothetical protein